MKGVAHVFRSVYTKVHQVALLFMLSAYTSNLHVLYNNSKPEINQLICNLTFKLNSPIVIVC